MNEPNVPIPSQFLCEALQQEQGGIEVYEAALRCVNEEELRDEWRRYRDETHDHVEIYTGICLQLGIDPRTPTLGRKIVEHMGRSLVEAMEMAERGGDRAAAETVAAECVVIAETKCHLNWELVGELADTVGGEPGRILRRAYEEVEEQEDEHLYHTMGWARELSMQRLGMKAAIPPPEEEKHVKSAIGAERAKNARKEYVGGKQAQERKTRKKKRERSE